MDSQCPVIENVDGNSNREDLNDTTAINDNELPSLNDNKSQEQSNEEEKRNLVNLQPAGEVKESAGGGEEVEKTDNETENDTDNSQKVREMCWSESLVWIVLIRVLVVWRVQTWRMIKIFTE